MTITPILAEGGWLIALVVYSGFACIILGLLRIGFGTGTARDRRTGAIVCVSGLAMIFLLYWLDKS